MKRARSEAGLSGDNAEHKQQLSPQTGPSSGTAADAGPTLQQAQKDPSLQDPQSPPVTGTQLQLLSTQDTQSTGSAQLQLLPTQDLQSTALVVTSQQEQIPPILDLDRTTAPLKRRQLIQGHVPYPQALQTWQDQQNNPAVCGARLIGNVATPTDYVGIAVQDLIMHSSWAAARLRQTDMQNTGMDTIVPVQTPAPVVRRMVEALYSGFVELQEDTEQLLILANCMQVKLIEEACTDYLLELSLPVNKLVQLLVLLDRLVLMDARKRLLKKYAHQTWTPEIMEILPPFFKQLLQGSFQEHTLCSEVLFSSQCGALCEVQDSSE